MKILLFAVLSFFTINACGQDYLLMKEGRTYFYQGKEYSSKQLGIVFADSEEAFSIYKSGQRNKNISKYIAVSGAVSIGAGFLILFTSNHNVYRLVYGSFAVMTGLFAETVALFFLVRGSLKKTKARKVFNFEMLERHGYNSEVSLAFGGTRHGIGLVLQF